MLLLPSPTLLLPGLLGLGSSSSIGSRPLSQRTALLLLMLSVLLSSPTLHSTSFAPSEGDTSSSPLSRTNSRVPFACAQQGGGEDGSQQDDSQDSMSANDPNLINPPNKQGYGRNVRTDIVRTQPARKSVKTETKKSMAEQTTQAALQLGVLVRSLNSFLKRAGEK